MSARPLLVALVVAGCGYDVPLGFHDAGTGTCGEAVVAGLYRDSTFGTCGLVTVDVGGVDNVGYGAGSFTVDAQNRPVIATTGGTPSNRNFATVRLTEAGALDPTFGTGGVVQVNAGLNVESAVGVLVQGDGKVVSAGFAIAGTALMEPKALMVRMLPSGALDTSLVGTGVHFPGHSGTHELCNALVPRPNGGVLCGGHGWPNFPGQTNLTLLSRNVDGSLDGTFGSNADGFATFDFSGGDEVGGALALLPDGKALLAGSTRSASSGFDFALLRVLPNGALDPAFSRVAADFAGGDDLCESILLRESGAALCAGSATLAGGATAGALLQVDSQGAPDPAFGTNGRLTLTGLDGASALLVLPDGGVLVGGEASGAAALQLVGSPLGPARLDLTSGADRVWALRDAGGGRVWVFGAANGGSGNNDLFVMRLSPRESGRFGVAGQCSATGLAPLGVLALGVLRRRRSISPRN